MNTYDFLTKYRPTELNKTFFTSDVKSKVTSILKDDNISSVVITGGAGSGKTTLARICAEGVKTQRGIADCVIKEYGGICLYSKGMQLADADIFIFDDFESVPVWLQHEIIEGICKQGRCKFVIFVTLTESALADEVKQFCQETISTDVDNRPVFMSIMDICNKEGIAYNKCKDGTPCSTGLNTLDTFVLKCRSSNIRTVLTCLEFCKSKGVSLEDGVNEFFKEEV